jgi:hypothetical protein
MKNVAKFCAIALLSIPGLCQAQLATGTQSIQIPPPTPPAIVSRDANSRVWAWTEYEQGPNGQTVPRAHSYTELASGLCYQQNGEWLDSQEQITIQPDGSAEAVQGAHQAYFPANIYNGDITLVTPDGLQLRSQPLGLSYDDGTNFVLIAMSTNSIGQLMSSNQILYPNAFEGIDADLVYTYKKGSFEQDLIFREQPPTPEQFGLNSSKARLQMLTEFLNPPTPVETAAAGGQQDGLQDTTLTFGRMKMTRGKAFSIGDNAQSNLNQIPVYKNWMTLNGRTVLVEEVPYWRLGAQLETLPLPATGPVTSGNPLLFKVSSKRLMPPARLVLHTANTIQMAKASMKQKRGVVFDYVAINYETNAVTFQSDSTYFVNGDVIIDSVATFEGGTVIKYASGTSIIEVDGTGNATAVWDTAPYRPAIFTSMDDNTVGEIISGSSGHPATPSMSGNYYIWVNGAGSDPYNPLPTIKNARFLYADAGIDADPGCNVWDCQFINCNFGIAISDYTDGGVANLYNVLFSHCSNAVTDYGIFSPETITAEHITVDNCGAFFDWYPGNEDSLQAYVTNSVFSNTPQIVDTNSTVTGLDNGFYNSPQFGSNAQTTTNFPYQVVGGGNYYLTTNCAFHSQGTTGIDSNLLAELSQKTTCPPIVYSNSYSNITFHVSTNLGPVITRDANSALDLGYHYDSIDYAFCEAAVAPGVNITFTAGTSVAWFSRYASATPAWTVGSPCGLALTNGSIVTFLGTATEPCVFTDYNDVQEGGNTNWMTGFLAGIANFLSTPVITNNPSVLNAQFTHFYHLAQDVNHYRDGGLTQPLKFQLINCEQWGFDGGYRLMGAFTNCLITGGFTVNGGEPPQFQLEKPGARHLERRRSLKTLCP